MGNVAGTKHKQEYTLSGVGVSDFAVVDPQAYPFLISVTVYVSSGADLVYSIEHTAEDINTPQDVAETISHACLVGQTSSADSNYMFPITGIRLRITSYTSGTATMIVRQAGAQRSLT